jgi:site-specific DNA-methyltransferase (adenine-specific)
VGQAKTATPALASANALYYGDNLQILREHIKDESVNLIYLDPPFNSNASYNTFFKAPTGERSRAQIEAFEDTWCWTIEAEQSFDQVMTNRNTDAAALLRAMRAFLNDSDMMAYLTMMAVRLLELHRVLKPTGSIYLHCDSTASHYLKLLLDSIFGIQSFKNDIIWKRKSGRGETNAAPIKYGVTVDNLLFYSKTANSNSIFHRPSRPNKQEYLENKFTQTDETGRKYTLPT